MCVSGDAASPLEIVRDKGPHWSGTSSPHNMRCRIPAKLPLVKGTRHTQQDSFWFPCFFFFISDKNKKEVVLFIYNKDIFVENCFVSLLCQCF